MIGQRELVFLLWTIQTSVISLRGGKKPTIWMLRWFVVHYSDFGNVWRSISRKVRIWMTVTDQPLTPLYEMCNRSEFTKNSRGQPISSYVDIYETKQQPRISKRSRLRWSDHWEEWKRKWLIRRRDVQWTENECNGQLLPMCHLFDRFT